MTAVDLERLQATCPLLLAVDTPEDSSLETHLCLPYQKLNLKADVFLGIAIVRMTAQWKNTSDKTRDCTLIVPCEGTVTSLQSMIGDRKDMFLTGILANSDVQSRFGFVPSVDLGSTETDGVSIEIDEDNTEQKQNSDEDAQSASLLSDDSDAFRIHFPDVFRSVIKAVDPGDEVTVVVEWTQPVPFRKAKGHRLRLPMQLPGQYPTYPLHAKWEDICSVIIRLNSLAEISSYDSKSHELNVLSKDKRGGVLIKVGKMKSLEEAAADGASKSDRQKKSSSLSSTMNEKNETEQEKDQKTMKELQKVQSVSSSKDQLLSDSLSLQSNHREFSLIFKTKGMKKTRVYAMKKRDEIYEELENPEQMSKEKKQKKKKQKVNVAVVVCPPRVPPTTFPRCVCIVLDRSGSMSGEPFEQCIEAIKELIETQLRKQDCFNVIGFDHRSICWRDSPVEATEENKQECLKFLHNIIPENGGTNMEYPIQQAMNQLNDPDQSLLPIMLLITDGSVREERDICSSVQDLIFSSEKDNNRVRIFAIGLGLYTNWFFLNALSQIGRGKSQVFGGGSASGTTTSAMNLAQKMSDFMKCFKTPLMTDLKLEIDGIESNNIDMFPSLMPDLFIDACTMIALDVECDDISEIKTLKLHGFDPDRKMIELECPIIEYEDVPIERLCAQQKLDSLSTRYWFQSSEMSDPEQFVSDLAQLSIALGVATAGVSSMVSLRCDRSEAFAQGLVSCEMKSMMMISEDDNKETEQHSIMEDSMSNSSTLSDEEFMQYQKPKERLKKKDDLLSVAAVTMAGGLGAAAIGAVLIASDLQTLGDIGLTSSNLPSFGGDFDLGGGEDCDCDCDGDECCGDCCGGDDDCLVM